MLGFFFLQRQMLIYECCLICLNEYSQECVIKKEYSLSWSNGVFLRNGLMVLDWTSLSS